MMQLLGFALRPTHENQPHGAIWIRQAFRMHQVHVEKIAVQVHQSSDPNHFVTPL
jgi:hypothetical protein